MTTEMSTTHSEQMTVALSRVERIGCRRSTLAFIAEYHRGDNVSRNWELGFQWKLPYSRAPSLTTFQSKPRTSSVTKMRPTAMVKCSPMHEIREAPNGE